MVKNFKDMFISLDRIQIHERDRLQTDGRTEGGQTPHDCTDRAKKTSAESWASRRRITALISSGLQSISEPTLTRLKSDWSLLWLRKLDRFFWVSLPLPRVKVPTGLTSPAIHAPATVPPCSSTNSSPLFRCLVFCESHIHRTYCPPDFFGSYLHYIYIYRVWHEWSTQPTGRVESGYSGSGLNGIKYVQL